MDELYEHRNLEELEPHYSKHVSAMTTQNLFLKSDIAAELAWRDKRLDYYEKLCRTQSYAIEEANHNAEVYRKQLKEKQK